MLAFTCSILNGFLLHDDSAMSCSSEECNQLITQFYDFSDRLRVENGRISVND